jgi:hypothetical protein
MSLGSAVLASGTARSTPPKLSAHLEAELVYPVLHLGARANSHPARASSCAYAAWIDLRGPRALLYGLHGQVRQSPGHGQRR